MGNSNGALPCLSEPAFIDVVMCASRLSSPGACNVSVCTTPPASRPKFEFHLKVCCRVLVQNGHGCVPARQFRGIRRCIDSRIPQLGRELRLQQCSAAERACKLQPIRDRLQHIVRAKRRDSFLTGRGIHGLLTLDSRHGMVSSSGRLYHFFTHICYARAICLFQPPGIVRESQ
jgi:hypothetical protein